VTGAAPGGAHRPALSPFTRTLLALCISAGPALSGVLPEDEADVMYHSYSGGGITVEGPSVLIRKKVGDSLSFTGNYYEDMISSASIDVRLSASPYHEIRKQKSIGAEYLHGKTTYSVGYINSVEPDYRADTTYYSVSQDMFGDLTTVTLGYKRAWDRIYRDICNAPHPDGTYCPDIINDPTFHQQADHRGYTFGVSQIITRNMLLDLNYEIDTDQGYLANPYREIRYLSPGGLGFTLAPQVYPNTRTSNAASVLVKYYLPWRAALTAQYRYYHDTWAVVGDTFELGYTLPVWHRWVFDTNLRYYTQSHASFFSDLFPRADYQNYEARDRELAAFESYTAGFGASYEFDIPKVPWIHKSSASLRVDRMFIDYSDYRNALLAGVYGAGNEPLYHLDATIFEAFVSVWF
ncbi:MAG: DUF3570 domain-containing protein, partial [Steroidobacteraceae bacterium]